MQTNFFVYMGLPLINIYMWLPSRSFRNFFNFRYFDFCFVFHLQCYRRRSYLTEPYQPHSIPLNWGDPHCHRGPKFSPVTT